VRILSLAICVLAAGISFAQQAARAPATLITSEDTKYWNELEKRVPKERGPAPPIPPGTPVTIEMLETEGPGIEIVDPKTLPVRPPLELRVQFVPHESSPDPGSIQVTAKKWIWGKFHGDRDITDHVRPYASAEGIHVPPQDFPAGRYQITLRVSDTHEKRSTGQMILEIASKHE
jgi:hypothetical protein